MLGTRVARLIPPIPLLPQLLSLGIQRDDPLSGDRIVRERRLKDAGQRAPPEPLERIVPFHLAITRRPFGRRRRPRRRPVPEITPARDNDGVAELDAVPIGPVLGEFDLDEVLRRALRAAALGPALGAEGDDGVGGVGPRGEGVAETVLDGLIPARFSRFGDVPEGALADVHELAVAPVRAHGEVGPVVVAVVEEEAHRAGGQARVREARADDAHQQVAVVVDEVASVMAPVVGFPAAAEGVDRDAVPHVPEAMGAHDELDEGEG